MNPVSGSLACDRRMTLLAYGEAVWSWRPLLALNRRRRCGLDRARKTFNPPVTVTRRIRRRGERGISRKAIAQGMSECSPLPCMLVCANCTLLAHETAGAARTRHSLRPLLQERGNEIAKLGQRVPRERLHSSSPGLTGRPSIPEADVIELRVPGVLDTRLRGHDGLGAGRERAQHPGSFRHSGISHPPKTHYGARRLSPQGEAIIQRYQRLANGLSLWRTV
jgi:hypothetical protein